MDCPALTPQQGQWECGLADVSKGPGYSLPQLPEMIFFQMESSLLLHSRLTVWGSPGKAQPSLPSRAAFGREEGWSVGGEGFGLFLGLNQGSTAY